MSSRLFPTDFLSVHDVLSAPRCAAGAPDSLMPTQSVLSST
jgi:hypothetical protein